MRRVRELGHRGGAYLAECPDKTLPLVRQSLVTSQELFE
jgi:hypothetical protein